MNKDKNAIALAGEFAVLSQLALRNYDANMTLGHTKGVDILVSDPRSKRMYRLEVKTKIRESEKQVANSRIFGTVVAGWLMNKKHETISDPSLFYCFVVIWERTKRFRFFIVPARVVARYVKKQQQLWCKKSEKGKNTEMRMFRVGLKSEKYPIATPTAEEYEDNWKFDN